jgi:hypothetical protein
MNQMFGANNAAGGSALFNSNTNNILNSLGSMNSANNNQNNGNVFLSNNIIDQNNNQGNNLVINGVLQTSTTVPAFASSSANMWQLLSNQHFTASATQPPSMVSNSWNNNIFGQSIASNQVGNNNQNNGNVFIDGVLQNPSLAATPVTQPLTNFAPTPAFGLVNLLSQPPAVTSVTEPSQLSIFVSSTTQSYSLIDLLSQLNTPATSNDGNVFSLGNVVGQNNNQGNVMIVDGVFQTSTPSSPFAFAMPPVVTFSQPPVQNVTQSSTVAIVTQPLSTAVVDQASFNSSVAQQTVSSHVQLLSTNISLNATVSNNTTNLTNELHTLF